MSHAVASSTDLPVHQRRTNIRWAILIMLFVVTTMNYACRGIVSIAGTGIEADLHINNVQMGYIFSAFAWSYVIAQLPGGWLLDRFGSKTTYCVALWLWSIFTVIQGAVGFLTGAAAVVAFFVLRLLLGVTEAPAFPANSRITAAWFPDRERGFASAVFNAAQYAGTAFFAPLTGWFVHDFGWEYAFVVVGGIGIVCALIWKKIIYAPKNHPHVNKAEFDYIREGGALVDMDAKNPEKPRAKVKTGSLLKQLLSSRMLLGVYVFQYCINVMTYFLLTWFPMYLVMARHMTILHAGVISAAPALCAFIGGLSGGRISDALINHGVTLSVARKTPIVFGMCLAMLMVCCNYIQSNTLIVAIMCLAFFGKGCGALGWAVVSDTSPKEGSGLSGSLFNTFGNIAGIVSPIVIGYLVQVTGNFSSALFFVAIHALIAIVAMVFVVGKIHRFQLKTA